jgi:hypothetical protein
VSGEGGAPGPDCGCCGTPARRWGSRLHFPNPARVRASLTCRDITDVEDERSPPRRVNRADAHHLPPLLIC